MGRKSALSDAQWEDVDRRLLEGDAARAIARELGVSEAIIRARKKTRVEKIKDAANQVVAADRAVKALDLPSQRIALTFAQKLQAMSDSLAEAAMLGVGNAVHLQRLGQAQLSKVTAANLGQSGAELAAADKLADMANTQAEIAVRVVSAQKDQVKKAHEVPPADAPNLSLLTEEELAMLERTMGKVNVQLLPSEGG